MKLMKRPFGLSLEIGFGNNSSWCPQIYIGPQKFGRIRPRARYDNESHYQRQGIDIAMHGGVKIDVGFGTVRRPIPKFWKDSFWSGDKFKKNTETNPWNSGNYWFVLTIPFCPYVFLSMMLGSRRSKLAGFYIGGRTAIVDAWTHQLVVYGQDGDVVEWICDPKDDSPVYAWGESSEDGNIYVQPTVCVRLDFS